MEDTPLYPIGDVARRTGLSVSAVRFYSDAGLVAVTDHTAGGYRLYDLHAIARLELVRTLRELDASVEDIRRLLTERTTLQELAAAHLELVERRLSHLQVRRAVLRTIVNQPTTAEQVTLMTKLVSMSDDERDQLIDAFWAEVTDGLDVHPSFIDKLRAHQPKLPAEPRTEQLEAWIELAHLVQDTQFRQALRGYFQNIYSSPRARRATEPDSSARMRTYLKVRIEARAARQAGVPADSVQALDIADRLVAAFAAVGNLDLAEARHRLATIDHEAADRQPVVVGYRELLGRYHALTATINGASKAPDPEATALQREWLHTALTTPRPEATATKAG